MRKQGGAKSNWSLFGKDLNLNRADSCKHPHLSSLPIGSLVVPVSWVVYGQSSRTKFYGRELRVLSVRSEEVKVDFACCLSAKRGAAHKAARLGLKPVYLWHKYSLLWVPVPLS